MILTGLHGRASAWYEAQGLDLEALHHAAAAADPARLAGLAERLWERMDSSFQSVAWCRLGAAAAEAVLRARPVLCVQYAWALLDAGEVEASEARLRDAERAMAALGNSAIVPDEAAEPIVVVVKEQLSSLPVRIAVARAYLAQARGDVAATVRHAALALASAADAEPLLRAQAEVLVGLPAGPMANWRRPTGPLPTGLSTPVRLATSPSRSRAASTWRRSASPRGSCVRRPGCIGSFSSLSRRTTRPSGRLPRTCIWGWPWLPTSRAMPRPPRCTYRRARSGASGRP